MSEQSHFNDKQQGRADQAAGSQPVCDDLTSVYNRRYFRNYLETEITRARRYYRSFSLCFIEVDDMKHYNTAHGDKEADKLLRFLAELLKTNIRASDLTCRYGEEEFVLVLPETPKKGAGTVAEKMRKTVEIYPFKGRDSQPRGTVTVSIGITSFPEDAFESDELIENGSEALLRARHTGGNNVQA